MSIQEKRLAFLNDTVKFYNSNNLSMKMKGGKSEACLYFMQGKAGCAIGRHIEDKELCKKFDDLEDSSVQAVFDKLPESLKELGMDFLGSVQQLHDNKANWSENGISAIGLWAVEGIEEDFLKN